LLGDLNPRLSAFEGQVSAAKLSRLYAGSDALLQPALYEPFGLTVGESLASGTPVVASDEVGAAAGVDPRVCRTFRAGDLDAFEAAVRRLVADIKAGRSEPLRQLARAEAERLFAPEVIGARLVVELERVARRDPAPHVAAPDVAVQDAVAA
jgi:glycosyltransferase involved in cell wall biosynthesis